VSRVVPSEFAPESLFENVKVVKAATLVAFRSTEEHDLDTDGSADATGAVSPWPGSQGCAVGFSPIGLVAPQYAVVAEGLEDWFDVYLAAVVPTQQFQYSTFQFDCFALVDLARLDAILQLGVSTDLWYTHREIASTGCVVIIAFIFERLSKRGRAVETGHPPTGERSDILASADT
jgi:hypothetical protein